MTLDDFLRYAVDTCVNPRPLPSLEVLPEGSTCPKCGANTSLTDYCSECDDVPCADPHQGCGCSRDESQGSHRGPCEYEGGYGDDGSHVACIHCAETREAGR